MDHRNCSQALMMGPPGADGVHVRRQDAMTSERLHATYRPSRSHATWSTVSIVMLLIGSFLTACSTPPPSKPVSPYTDQQIWAVAPLQNESGTSLVDGAVIADRITYALGDVHGVTALPVNRVFAAMDSANMRTIDSPEQARVLCRTLEADAILLGSITAYDPYDPPVFGASLVLIRAEVGDDTRAASYNPRPLMGAYTDRMVLAWMGETGRSPTAVALHLDGAASDVRALTEEYARGRSTEPSALGWERYIKSMELFTEFACHRIVVELLDAERLRLSGSPAGP
jgi:hypothetical protein